MAQPEEKAFLPRDQMYWLLHCDITRSAPSWDQATIPAEAVWLLCLCSLDIFSGRWIQRAESTPVPSCHQDQHHFQGPWDRRRKKKCLQTLQVLTPVTTPKLSYVTSALWEAKVSLLLSVLTLSNQQPHSVGDTLHSIQSATIYKCEQWRKKGRKWNQKPLALAQCLHWWVNSQFWISVSWDLKMRRGRGRGRQREGREGRGREGQGWGGALGAE